MKSILVPMGNTEHSKAALKIAVMLADKGEAFIRGLYVKDIRKMQNSYLDTLPYPTISPDLNQSIIDKSLESVITEMDREETQVSQVFHNIIQEFKGGWEFIIESGDLSQIVLKEEKAVDLIVMGKSRESKNPKTPVLSKHARDIIQKSYRSCLVITDGYYPGDSILLAYGGSPSAGKALTHTAKIAGLFQAKVYVLSVDEDYENALPHLKTAEKYLKAYGIEAELIWKKPEVVKAIVSTVEEKNIKMAAMGAYGHESWKQLIFGSNTEKAIKNLNIPLLLCS